MADELKRTFNAESELIKSSGGVFEIELNGTLIFSKAKLGRFPDEGEIAKLVRERN
ncbi:MAG: Rdx family protein [Candidatus Melainabacteria bacterium]|nr:Rdx family protein [Candidatus Melainabacteria bacterium]